jgi:Domain of unknown function (DUF4126)
MDNNSLVFLIGLGLGLGVAAGVRPFLPALLAGGLASAGVLGMRFSPGNYSFLQASWWLIVIAAVLLLLYVVQLRVSVLSLDSPASVAAFGGVAIGIGALLFAGGLCARGDSAWPGLIGGAVAALIAEEAVRPFAARVRSRLKDRTAREAVTLYLDAISLVIAGLTAVLHPLGYVALLLFVWFALAGRRRDGGRYAGLRILGR